MFNWVLQDKEKCVINEDESADGKQIIWGLKTIVLGAQSGTQNTTFQFISLQELNNLMNLLIYLKNTKNTHFARFLTLNDKKIE